MCAVRILIVDDSAFMRMTLARRLAAEPDLEVVGTARDGQEGLAQVKALQPDVVTLDVEMPGADGLTVLSRIMAERPTPVIMVSSLTQEGAETTVRALTLGAFDFVGKPSQVAGTREMVADLAVKIRNAAKAKLRRPRVVLDKGQPPTPDKLPLRTLGASDKVLIIGSSTGGPAALRHLMTDLRVEPDTAGVIVQHMPPTFTNSLAVRLNEISAWSVREAAAGNRLQCGLVLLAPGGQHLVYNQRRGVCLTDDPPVNNVRPAVDVTMQSLAREYGKRVLAVVLTGMGRDGTAGALAIKAAGGMVIAEAESSCVVYGMPRSVVEAGAADYVAPLPEIAQLVHSLLTGNVP